VGESAPVKDMPRMMVTLTLETCLARVMQKQGIPSLDLFCIATRNQHKGPGQATIYSGTEQRLGNTRGSSPRRYAPDANAADANSNAPTHQGGSNNRNAQKRIMGRRRKQRGRKSGSGVPEERTLRDRLKGNQQRILKKPMMGGDEKGNE
jgi:hypothetical protein